MFFGIIFSALNHEGTHSPLWRPFALPHGGHIVGRAADHGSAPLVLRRCTNIARVVVKSPYLYSIGGLVWSTTVSLNTQYIYSEPAWWPNGDATTTIVTAALWLILNFRYKMLNFSRWRPGAALCSPNLDPDAADALSAGFLPRYGSSLVAAHHNTRV